MCCIHPRIHINSTHQQVQNVTNKIVNKRITRNDLKVLALPVTTSLSDSRTQKKSASSVSCNNNSKSKSSNKMHSKSRPMSKPKKTKGQALQRTLQVTL